MGNRFSIGLTTPHRAECIQMQSIKIAKKSGRFWRLVYFSIPRRRTTCVEPFPQWRNGFSIGTNSKKKSSRKETTARNTLLYYIYTKLRKFVFEMIKSAIKIKYWTFIKSVNKFPPFLPTKKKYHGPEGGQEHRQESPGAGFANNKRLCVNPVSQAGVLAEGRWNRDSDCAHLHLPCLLLPCSGVGATAFGGGKGANFAIPLLFWFNNKKIIPLNTTECSFGAGCAKDILVVLSGWYRSFGLHLFHVLPG